MAHIGPCISALIFSMRMFMTVVSAIVVNEVVLKDIFLLIGVVSAVSSYSEWTANDDFISRTLFYVCQVDNMHIR